MAIHTEVIEKPQTPEPGVLEGIFLLELAGLFFDQRLLIVRRTHRASYVKMMSTPMSGESSTIFL